MPESQKVGVVLEMTAAETKARQFEEGAANATAGAGNADSSESANITVLKRAVRKLLRADGVRLWEPPYSRQDGSSSITDEVVRTYAAKAEADPDAVATALEILRVSARKKLTLPSDGPESSNA